MIDRQKGKELKKKVHKLEKKLESWHNKMSSKVVLIKRIDSS